MPNKFSTPTQSTYVSQYVPLPVDNLLQVAQAIQERHDTAQEQIDALTTLQSQLRGLEQDRPYLTNALNQSRQEIESLTADGLLSQRLRQVRSAARNFGLNVAAPIQERLQWSQTRREALEKQGFSGSALNQRLQEELNSLPGLNPEVVGSRTYLPSTGRTWEDYVDFQKELLGIAGDIKRFVRPTDLSPGQYQLLMDGQISELPPEVVEAVLIRAAGSGRIGRALQEQALLDSRQQGISLDQARRNILDPILDIAIGQGARSDMTMSYRTNPEYDGTSRGNTIFDRLRFFPDSSGLTFHYNPSDATVENSQVVRDARSEYVRDNPLPQILQGASEETRNKFLADAGFRQRVVDKARALIDNNRAINQGPEANIASRRRRVEQLRSELQDMGLGEGDVNAARAVINYASGLDQYLEDYRQTVRDENTSMSIDRFRVTDDAIQQEIQGLFGEARSLLGNYDVWKVSDGDRLTEVNEADDLRDFREVDPNTIYMTTPIYGSERFMATLENPDNHERQTFMIMPKGSNWPRLMGQRLSELRNSDEYQQVLGRSMTNASRMRDQDIEPSIYNMRRGDYIQLPFNDDQGPIFLGLNRDGVYVLTHGRGQDGTYTPIQAGGVNQTANTPTEAVALIQQIREFMAQHPDN